MGAKFQDIIPNPEQRDEILTMMKDGGYNVLRVNPKGWVTLAYNKKLGKKKKNKAPKNIRARKE